MNYKAIDVKFSETVAEWMAKGYVINTGTMSGFGSREQTKIDLTNGKEIIRVLLSNDVDTDSEESDDCYISYSGYSLIVGRVPNVPKEYKPHTCRNFGSPWNHELEILSRENFYRISAKYDGEWFGTKEEAAESAKLHRTRVRARMVNTDKMSDEWAEKAKSAILPFVKRQPGCKTATLKDIKSVRKHTYTNYKNEICREYWISVRNKNLTLV